MTTSIEERQITLNKKGDNIYVITFTGSPNKANVFNTPLLKRLDQLLDEVEAYSSSSSSSSTGTPCALIVTGAGRFFSAGFDTKALTGKSLAEQQQQQTSSTMSGPNPQGQEMVQLSWRILARLLVFPMPTIAVFNGHAYGLGFFIGMACDHRIMLEQTTTKAAFLCLPEINIGLPLGTGFAALAKCKLPKKALKDSALTGKQWTYQEAIEYGIIDAVVPKPNSSSTSSSLLPWVPPEAFGLAEELASTSEKGNLSSIKFEIYGDTHSILSRAKSRL
jgi:enoyl-CoA hydratase/carnithine racemase